VNAAAPCATRAAKYRSLQERRSLLQAVGQVGGSEQPQDSPAHACCEPPRRARRANAESSRHPVSDAHRTKRPSRNLDDDSAHLGRCKKQSRSASNTNRASASHTNRAGRPAFLATNRPPRNASISPVIPRAIHGCSAGTRFCARIDRTGSLGPGRVARDGIA